MTSFSAVSAHLLRSAATSERRRHQRVPVKLFGRYMLEDRREYPCQTIDMSPGGLALFAPVKANVDARVVIYLDQLGRLEGTARRHIENGFALTLGMSDLKRDRLADQLTWFANQAAVGLPEDRRFERIIPRQTRVTLTTPDGREHSAIIVDVSMSGAAIKTNAMPEIGALVTIGSTRGRVTRLFAAGVAVEFLRLIPTDMFDENIAL